MVNKFTLGPWEWARDDEQVVSAENGFPICDIRLSDEFSAELEANAALIAAAPDMLAALEEIAEAHVPDQPAAYDVDDYTWALQHVARLRRIALAAIAKARGE